MFLSFLKNYLQYLIGDSLGNIYGYYNKGITAQVTKENSPALLLLYFQEPILFFFSFWWTKKSPAMLATFQGLSNVTQEHFKVGMPFLTN